MPQLIGHPLPPLAHRGVQQARARGQRHEDRPPRAARLQPLDLSTLPAQDTLGHSPRDLSFELRLALPDHRFVLPHL